MSATRTIVAGLYGAARLARADPAGAHLFGTDAMAFWTSFWAAAIVLPSYGLLVLLTGGEALQTIEPGRFFALEAVTYIIGWVLFPLLIAPFCDAIGRSGRWVPYIVAHNWASVLQANAFLFATALAATGLLPDAVNALVLVTTTALVLLYQWFVARVVLDTSPAAAAMAVAIDIMTALMVFVGAHMVAAG